MESFDDMDIEEMISNPFKNIDMDRKIPVPKKQDNGVTDQVKEKSWEIPKKQGLSQDDYVRMEKNHPIEDRVLSLEKKVITSDQKTETLKRIINEQNERIQKIEEEFDLLRRYITGEEIESDENSDSEKNGDIAGGENTLENGQLEDVAENNEIILSDEENSQLGGTAP